jgi:hypothetical protein
MERTVNFWDQFTFERPLNLYFVARGQKIRLSLSMCHVGLSVQRLSLSFGPCQRLSQQPKHTLSTPS